MSSDREAPEPGANGGASSPGRKLLREAGWLLAYFVGASLFTFPLVLDISRAVTDLGDPLLNSWIIAWTAHQLPRDPFHLFDANVLYPVRASLSHFDHLVGLGLLVAPVNWIFGKAVAAHNMALLLSIAISGYGMHRLVRYLTGSTAAAVIAGCIFAFAPYRAGQLSHVQLQAAGWVPLLFLCLSRYVEAGKARHAVGLGVFVWLTSASSGYYGVYSWILLAVAVPYELLRSGGWRLGKRWMGLSLALILSALAYLPLALPYLRRSEDMKRPVTRMQRPAAKQHSYLRSPSHLHQALGLRRANPEQNLFPGFLALALAAGGLLGLDRRSGLYLLLGGVAFWASLGPSAGLYTFLHRYVPGVEALRVPARFGIFVLFALAVLAGLAAGRLLRYVSGRSRILLATGLSALVFAESFAGPHHFVRAPETPEVYRWLNSQPGQDPLVELPMPECDEFRRNALYMMWSTSHFKPLAFGCVLAAQLEQFPDAEGMEALRKLGIRYVILHRDLYLRHRAVKMEEAIDRQSGLVKVHRTTRETVYEFIAGPIPTEGERPISGSEAVP